jgi:hypothetical protein
MCGYSFSFFASTSMLTASSKKGCHGRQPALMMLFSSSTEIDMAVDASSDLCVVDQNLVDIDGADIESVTAVPHTDVLTSLKEMIATMRY